MSKIRRSFECSECDEHWKTVGEGDGTGAFIREACPKCGYDVQNDDIDFAGYAIIQIAVFTDEFDHDAILAAARSVHEQIKAMDLPEGVQITMDETGGY